MRPRAILCLGVGLTVLSASGCSTGPERPQAGDSWQIEAVDLSGANGTITVERGAIIAMPERVRFIPDASQGILVHISYEPDRPNDAGYGAFDWGARLACEEDEFESGMLPRVLPLLEAVDWPVEPFLGTKLPESADPSPAGWSSPCPPMSWHRRSSSRISRTWTACRTAGSRRGRSRTSSYTPREIALG